MRKKYSTFHHISSVIIGVGIGLLFGWSIGGVLERIFGFPFQFIFIPLFIIIGLLLALSKPALTEALAFGISILILLQAWWDLGADDWNMWRSVMSISALLLLIFNIFTGKLRIGSFWKTLFNSLGIKRRGRK